jgi:hypothetical protein
LEHPVIDVIGSGVVVAATVLELTVPWAGRGIVRSVIY